MAKTTSSVEVREGVVVTDPADFAKAIDLVRRKKISSLSIRYDLLDKKPNPPVADLALLREVPFVDDFSIAEMSVKRLANFDSIYELKKLKKLGVHTFKQLDLSRFPRLEMLFVADAPGLTGWEALSELRYARIWKLRADDLSFLSGMRRLSELWIIQTPSKRLRGLDASPSLLTLDISHSSKLESIDALPKNLVKLKIKKCSKLQDLSFLVRHPSLEFLYVDVMKSVAFVPGLGRLNYLGFENVLDGNLEPLLKNPSLGRVGFVPEKRKHYTHSAKELNALLAARKR